MKYPIQITYDAPDVYAEYNKVLKTVIDNTRMTRLAENILQVEYPSDLVRQIRVVNVDDCIFRLDFILYNNEYNRYCFFPHCGWNRENLFSNGRINNYIREESDGKLVLTFPEL